LPRAALKEVASELNVDPTIVPIHVGTRLNVLFGVGLGQLFSCAGSNYDVAWSSSLASLRWPKRAFLSLKVIVDIYASTVTDKVSIILRGGSFRPLKNRSTSLWCHLIVISLNLMSIACASKAADFFTLALGSFHQRLCSS
jgi:hypothetical protein